MKLKTFNQLIRESSPTKTIALILSLVLIISLFSLSISIFANHNVDSINDKSDKVQSQYILANDVYSLLQNIDIKQRDYILSGNKATISNQTNLEEQINKDIINLKVRTNVKVVDQDTQAFFKLVKLKEKQFNQTALTYRTQGVASAIKTLPASEATNQEIEKLVSSIESQQLKLLDDYKNSRTAYEEVSNFASGFVILLELSVFILTIYLVRQGIAKEKLLEKRQSEFIAIGSHQLRTPATAIKQYVYMLSNGFFGSINQRQKDTLNTIDDANNRSIAVANNLLYASQIESGITIVDIKTCDLKDIINNALTNYQSTFKSRGLKLKIEISKKPLLTLGDYKYLSIAFEILLDNACRYSPNGTTVFVSLKEVNQQYVLKIKDQGVGISANDQKQLFQKFTRFNNGKIMHPDGSGVGLYLLKHIIDEENIGYSITSKLNKGTTFSLYFTKHQQEITD